jgi:hypothetical protein
MCSYLPCRRCTTPTLRLRHALGWVVLWSTPGTTAGLAERYQCAVVTLLCGCEVHLSAGSNAAERRGGELVYLRPDAPWSASRAPTLAESRRDPWLRPRSSGEHPDQAGARAAATAAARDIPEARRGVVE